MKSLIISCNVTLDGFMAGTNNDLDSLSFIVDDPLLENELAEDFRAGVDTIVVGRQTFLDMAAYWTTVNNAMAAWLNKTPKKVLSTDGDFDVSVWKNSSLVLGDGVEQMRSLKESSGGSLVAFGGVKTLQALVTADLVDEYWLKVSPTLIGRGSSMFTDISSWRKLTLRAVKSYPSGIVHVRYTKEPESASYAPC